jgi:hypothetical protein
MTIDPNIDRYPGIRDGRRSCYWVYVKHIFTSIRMDKEIDKLRNSRAVKFGGPDK